MFDIQMTANGVAGRPDAQAWALRLYRRAVLAGQIRRALARLLGRPAELRRAASARGARAGGVRAVALAEIVGSEGRSADFDAGFAPLQEHSRGRWVSVALARRHGASLPPVSLIAGPGGYYVRDGHHRISVARALGEQFIEAELVG